MAKDKNIWIYAIVGVLLLSMMGYIDLGSITGGILGAPGIGTTEQPTIVYESPGSGTASTLYINYHDWATNSHSEVYPPYYVTKQGSVVYIVENENANTTNVQVGDTVSIYPTGNDYYGNSIEGHVIVGTAPIVSGTAYSVGTKSSIAVTARDKDETALTADDGDNNTANYAGGNLGADDSSETYYLKVSNNQADKHYNIYGVCTYYMGNMKDFEMIESGWTEVNVFDKMDSATITERNDANTSYTGNWKKCFKRDTPLILEEQQDSGWLKFNAKTKSTQPAANSGDFFGAVFLDGGWGKGDDDIMYNDMFVHDENELSGGLGINETAQFSAPHDGYVSITIEGQ